MTYDHFSVGDANSNYTLSISGFSQLNDRLQADTFVEINNGMMFSTRDRDNDDWDDGHAAVDLHSGGWWYSEWTYINMNGIYAEGVTQTDTGIILCFIDTFSELPQYNRAVMTTEMKLRPRI